MLSLKTIYLGLRPEETLQALRSAAAAVPPVQSPVLPPGKPSGQ